VVADPASAGDRGEAYLLTAHDRARYTKAHPNGPAVTFDHALAHLRAERYLNEALGHPSLDGYAAAHHIQPDRPGAHRHATG